MIAVVDLQSFRRIPWEDDIPFFLCSFWAGEGKRVEGCPRGCLRRLVERLEERGWKGMAGGELIWGRREGEADGV